MSRGSWWCFRPAKLQIANCFDLDCHSWRKTNNAHLIFVTQFNSFVSLFKAESLILDDSQLMRKQTQASNRGNMFKIALIYASKSNYFFFNNSYSQGEAQVHFRWSENLLSILLMWPLKPFSVEFLCADSSPSNGFLKQFHHPVSPSLLEKEVPQIKSKFPEK